MPLSEEDWEKILVEVETACDETKTIDRKQVLDTTDRLYDQIRSGEEIPEKKLVRILQILQKFYDKFGNHWIIISTTSFVLQHLYGKFGTEYLDGKDIHFLTSLISYTYNSKREIRDAVAQSLGSLASVYGSKIFEAGVTQYIKEEKKKFEALEGFMVALGYITSNLKDLNLETLNILIENCEDTKFDTYSSYIRTQALRGLYRVLNSKHSLSKELKSKIEEKAFGRLGDLNINVRKEAAKVTTNLGLPVDTLVKKLLTLLQEAKAWEIRYGVCYSFLTLSQNSNLVTEASSELVKVIFETLKKEVERTDKDVNSYNANSVAGIAITQLFVTLQNDLISSLKNLSIEGNQDYYKDYVDPTINFMFKAQQAQLLDSAGTSFMLLMNKAPKFISDKDKLMTYLFKNRFHASGPIQISAKVVWQFGKTDENYLGNLTKSLFDYLIPESEISNFEVKESIFKAMDEIFQQTTYDKIPVDETFKSLILGSKTTGLNSEVPKSAAINALSSFVSYVKKYNLKNDFIPNLMIYSCQLLSSETEEMIVMATLNLIKSMIENYPSLLQKMDLYIHHIYSLTKDESLENDNVKYLALQIISKSLGDVQDSIKKSNQLLPYLLVGFKKPYSFSEDSDVEKKEASSRVIKELTSLELGSTEFSNDSVKKILKILTNGLFIEKDSLVLQSNLLLSIRSLFKNENFLKAFSQEGKTFSDQLLIYFSFILTNNLDNYNEDEEKLSKFKSTTPFNYYNLGRLKCMIDIIGKLQFFASKELLTQFNELLGQFLYQQDPKYHPYLPKLLYSLINDKVTSSSILQIAKAFVGEFEVKGFISTSQQIVDQCIGLLKSEQFSQVPLDKKNPLFNHLLSALSQKTAKVEGVLPTLLEKVAQEQDILLKGKYIQLISLLEDDNLLENLSKLYEMHNIASDDEKYFYSIEKPSLNYGLDMDVFTPFYLNNLIIKSLSKWWNKDRIESSIKSLKNEKIVSILSSSVQSGFISNELYEILLSNISLKDVEKPDQLLKIGYKIQSVKDQELIEKWKEFSMNIFKDGRKKVSNYSIVLSCIISGLTFNSKYSQEYLQLLSDFTIEEEIEEDKSGIKLILNDLQKLNIILPPPRNIKKTDFNSTFSQKQ